MSLQYWNLSCGLGLDTSQQCHVARTVFGAAVVVDRDARGTAVSRFGASGTASGDRAAALRCVVVRTLNVANGVIVTWVADSVVVRSDHLRLR